MPSKPCCICHKRHADKPWVRLLDGREPGPNMLAIGYRRHHFTGLDLMGCRMPDDDGVMRCVSCLQAWDGRRGPLVTGYELMCCGQEWRPEQATRAAVVPPAAKVRPPSLTAEAYLDIVREDIRGMVCFGTHLRERLMTEIGPAEVEAEWVYRDGAIDADATARALVQAAVDAGLVRAPPL